MAKQQNLSLSLVTVTVGITLFTTFLPKFTEIRQASAADGVMRRDVNTGLMTASIVVLALAAGLAYATKDGTPLMIGGATSAGLIVAYETALHSGAA